MSLETPTAAVLFARAIVAESIRQMANGHDPEAIKRGIDVATEAAMEAFRKCWCAPDGPEGAWDRLPGGIAIAEFADAGSPARESAFRRKKARLDEALHALGCAWAALSDLRGASKGEDAGIAAVRFALEAPSRQIAKLAGQPPEIIVNSVLEGIGQYGIAVSQGGAYADLVEAGALDAHRAIGDALKCASEVGERAISGSDPLFSGLNQPSTTARFSMRRRP